MIGFRRSILHAWMLAAVSFAVALVCMAARPRGVGSLEHATRIWADRPGQGFGFQAPLGDYFGVWLSRSVGGSDPQPSRCILFESATGRPYRTFSASGVADARPIASAGNEVLFPTQSQGRMANWNEGQYRFIDVHDVDTGKVLNRFASYSATMDHLAARAPEGWWIDEWRESNRETLEVGLALVDASSTEPLRRVVSHWTRLNGGPPAPSARRSGPGAFAGKGWLGATIFHTQELTQFFDAQGAPISIPDFGFDAVTILGRERAESDTLYLGLGPDPTKVSALASFNPATGEAAILRDDLDSISLPASYRPAMWEWQASGGLLAGFTTAGPYPLLASLEGGSPLALRTPYWPAATNGPAAHLARLCARPNAAAASRAGIYQVSIPTRQKVAAEMFEGSHTVNGLVVFFGGGRLVAVRMWIGDGRAFVYRTDESD